eukprot:TRINITY_DN17014_c0_g1_i1.p1 TRINITY_DN17014_c0_g1~~TRINITY_DN17014_c0_g1_i1.p1  ORF type:complete len:109 (+),score=9.34 TRINITY_DN17014_c0_g1_i1:66-392(+)
MEMEWEGGSPPRRESSTASFNRKPEKKKNSDPSLSSRVSIPESSYFAIVKMVLFLYYDLICLLLRLFYCSRLKIFFPTIAVLKKSQVLIKISVVNSLYGKTSSATPSF